MEVSIHGFKWDFCWGPLADLSGEDNNEKTRQLCASLHQGETGKRLRKMKERVLCSGGTLPGSFKKEIVSGPWYNLLLSILISSSI